MVIKISALGTMAAVVLGVAPGATILRCQSTTDLNSLRPKVLKAVGATNKPPAWTLSGNCHIHGIDEKFDLDVDISGRFSLQVTGACAEYHGFDGSRYWVGSRTGLPHQDIGIDVQGKGLAANVLGGNWITARFQPKASDDASEDLCIDVRAPSGTFNSKVALDTRSFLPKSLTCWGPSGDEVWTFADYRSFSGRLFPTVLHDHSGQDDDVYTIVTAKPMPDRKSAFQMPLQSEPSDFVASAPSMVEIRQIADHLFVRPKVNGQEGGWFFFDTGAEAMCVDQGFAKKAGLTEVGHVNTAGVVGSENLSICQGEDFQLGPLSYKHPTFLVMDLAPFSKVMGIELAGICGYDFLSRAVFDVDLKASTLTIIPLSDRLSKRKAFWTPIKFSDQIPTIRCDFDVDKSGWFRLDTGSGSTVDIYSPTVSRLKLIEGHQTSAGTTGGAGGEAPSRKGEIEDFVLAGHRFQHPKVGLQTTTVGDFASPYFDGNIGMGFLAHFHIVLDYSRSRIAFDFVK